MSASRSASWCLEEFCSTLSSRKLRRGRHRERNAAIWWLRSESCSESWKQASKISKQLIANMNTQFSRWFRCVKQRLSSLILPKRLILVQLPVCCRPSILHQQTAARCRFSLSHPQLKRPDGTTRQPGRTDTHTHTQKMTYDSQVKQASILIFMYWYILEVSRNRVCECECVPGIPSLSSHWLLSQWIWPRGQVLASEGRSYCGWTSQWRPHGLPVRSLKDTFRSITLIDPYRTDIMLQLKHSWYSTGCFPLQEFSDS